MSASLLRTRWAAIGAAIAIAFGGGTILAVNATGSDPAGFVSISPCRLLDTRPTSVVGQKNTPLMAGTTAQYRAEVHGSNGNCFIPDSAVAVVMNVTTVGATAGSHLRIYPADVGLPTAANMSFGPLSGAVSNGMTVRLSADGAVRFFNANGSVHVVVDITGYYEPITMPSSPIVMGVSNPARSERATSDVYLALPDASLVVAPAAQNRTASIMFWSNSACFGTGDKYAKLFVNSVEAMSAPLAPIPNTGFSEMSGSISAVVDIPANTSLTVTVQVMTEGSTYCVWNPGAWTLSITAAANGN